MCNGIKDTYRGKENYLLASLPPNLYEKLAPHFQYVSLKQGERLHEPGETIQDIYFPIDCLLILLNQFGRSLQEYAVMGQRIRQSAGIASHAPIIVMAEQYGADMEGKDIQVDKTHYVTYLEDGQQLMNLLQRLCS